MRIFKYLIILFVLCGSGMKGFPQVGLRASYIKYSGTQGYAVKPGVSLAIRYTATDPLQHYRLGAALGFFSLNARNDTLTSIFYSTDGTVSPGYQTLDKFNVLFFRVENGFRLFNTNVSPLIGMENGFSITSTEGTKQNRFTDETFIGSSFELETMPKVELLCNFEQLELGFGFSKCFTHTETLSLVNSYWKSYINLNYYF